MPVYVYKEILEDGSDGGLFEIVQSMKEDALTTHPETGRPVKRVYLPPNLAYKHTEGQNKQLLDNSRIEKAGFTKYEKDKLTGTYHKVAGKGNAAPDVLHKPADL